jgi:hypothetical protein
VLPKVREFLDDSREPRVLRQHAGLFMHLVGAVEFAQVARDGGVDLAEPPLDLLPRVALRLGVDRLELAAVDGDDARVQLIDVAAQRDELLADLADGRAVVPAEVGDGLEVRREPAGQPDQLEIARAFALEPTRRLHLVEIAIDVELQHRRWMIPGASCRFGLGIEAERRQVQHVDEGIDRTHRIVRVDIVVDAFRKERGLTAIQPFYEALHGSPRSQCGNHTMLRSSARVFTQALCTTDVTACLEQFRPRHVWHGAEELCC